MKTFMYIVALIALLVAAILSILWYRAQYQPSIDTMEEEAIVTEVSATPTPLDTVSPDPSAEDPRNIFAY